MTTSTAKQHKVVSQDDWLRAHREFLAKEKELTKRNDELSRERLELPWTLVEKDYVFAGLLGVVLLAVLFVGWCLFVLFYFMFAHDWSEGCPSCSYVTDHFNGMIEHLNARDVTLVLVSRAPQAKLSAFQNRLGWRIPWYSSGGCDFNQDFGVTFTKDEVERGVKEYNLDTMAPYSEENPGLSFFYKDPSGTVLHTYSTYARGLDGLLGAYAVLDRAPKGRNEAELPSPMSWVRYHDKYEPNLQQLESCCHQAKH